jgi:hypothetical protein
MLATTSKTSILNEDGVVVVRNEKTTPYFKMCKAFTTPQDRPHPKKMTEIWEGNDNLLRRRAVQSAEKLSHDWRIHFKDGTELLSVIYSKARFFFLENKEELSKVVAKNKKLVMAPMAD